MRTPDLAASNVEKIAGLFPHCVTEAHDADGALRRMIDWDLLRQELSSDLVQGAEERYRLDWPGKRQALYTGNMPINKTLRPCRSDSVDFDRSENLFIEGDNLDVLKLLRHTYMGKVKMIYIDPPYNTGKDFIYRDNYATSRAEYMRSSSQVDDAGNRLVANNESNGRFHSDWLSMMYPRLRLAQELLRDDGVIFISIDDNEQASLKRLCDEVFGEGNFVANLIWRNGRTSAAHFTNEHEYIAVFAKSINDFPLFNCESNESISDRAIKRPTTKNPVSSIYFPAGVDFDSDDKIFPNEFGNKEPIKIREGVFECVGGKLANDVKIDAAWSMKEMIELWLQGEDIIDQKGQKIKRFFFGKNGVLQYEKEKGTIHPKSIITGFTTKQGSKLIESIFDGSKFFDYPKPARLIDHLIGVTTDRNNSDIILDFFSGSATTAHAVMQLNAEDGGNRKFIMVQLPEACDPKSEAYKAGYKTIADIGRERIRRAGAKILAGECHESWNKDVGFRSLLVDSSNMNNAYYSPAETQQGQLDLWAREYIKLERSGEDLLFQVLLDWGLGLTLPIERQQICGLEVFIVDDNQLVACFAQAGEIDDELFYHLAKLRPRRALFRSSGLTVDSTQTNAEQIFGLISPSTEIKIL